MNEWKGLILDIKKEGVDKIMLYNLDDDPLEQNDVSREHPEIIKLMRQKMDDSHEEAIVEKFRF